MDDASFSQDTMNGDPNAMGPMGPDPMNGDPNAMGPDQMGATDDTMGATDDTMGATDDTMDTTDDGNEDPQVTATSKKLEKLTRTDLNAADNYIESMLSNYEGNGEQEGPMMETVIFTKKQLNKLQEGLGVANNDIIDKHKGLEKKTDKKPSNSPFSTPSHFI